MCCDRLGAVRRRGFTLMELMVVIVLLGLLAGAVTVGVRSYLISGKQKIAKMEISKICHALETFYSHYDRYPTNDEGLAILTEPSEEFADGLLSKLPIDPWGNPYQFNEQGSNGRYEVICFGADGQEGGEGADRDISSNELEEENAS